MMARLKVQVDVEILEFDGVDLPVGKSQQMRITPHWNIHGWHGWLVIKVPGAAKSITVAASDLKAAISRCTGIE